MSASKLLNAWSACFSGMAEATNPGWFRYGSLMCPGDPGATLSIVVWLVSSGVWQYMCVDSARDMSLNLSGRESNLWQRRRDLLFFFPSHPISLYMYTRSDMFHLLLWWVKWFLPQSYHTQEPIWCLVLTKPLQQAHKIGQFIRNIGNIATKLDLSHEQTDSLFPDQEHSGFFLRTGKEKLDYMQTYTYMYMHTSQTQTLHTHIKIHTCMYIETDIQR